MKSTKGDTDSKKSSKSAKSSEIDQSPPKSRSRASPSRSPARGRKQSPGPRGGRKSPSRKSPSRKSPSRKSPSRKSPSRSTKDAEDGSKSPSRRLGIKTDSKSESSSKQEITKLAQVQKKLADVNGLDATTSRDGLRERKIKADEPASDASKIGSRRSIRIKVANDNFEKLLSLAQSTKLPKTDRSFETFSDEDDDGSPKQKNRSATRKLLTPTEDVQKVPLKLLSKIGVIVNLIIPVAFIVGVNVACNKTQCNFIAPLSSLKEFKNPNVWFSSKAVLVYISYVILQSVFSLLPCCGKKVSLPDTDAVFVANGLFVASLLLAGMGILEIFNIPIFQIVHQQYYSLLTVAIITGTLLAIALYIKSRKTLEEERNSSGNSGYFLYDLWAGREINPVLLKKINVKLLSLRISLVACVILNIVYLYLGVRIKNFPILSSETLRELGTYKQIAGAVSISPTLLTFGCLQLFYFVHALYGESSLVSTFEYQYEGTGFMLTVGHAIYPFITPIINKCILEHNIVLSNYVLALAVASYAIGFYIYSASNSQKNSFRANPFNPKLAHLDSIPTFHGNRLLVSGWWGFVRHPNYLGDIILHLSLGMPVITAPPVLFVVSVLVLLALRSKRDGERCHKRYGAAWERYCRRVPYVLVPKVY